MAEIEKDSLKKHGDELETALEGSETRTGSASKMSKPVDSIPIPENGGHDKSHAAHLGHVHEQTKPADKLKQGMGSNTLREPPTVVNRVGKQHR